MKVFALLIVTFAKDDIADFLHRCNIEGGNRGIFINTDDRGRASGDAYVELESAEDLENALKMHKRDMGSRWVDRVMVGWGGLSGLTGCDAGTSRCLRPTLLMLGKRRTWQIEEGGDLVEEAVEAVAVLPGRDPRVSQCN